MNGRFIDSGPWQGARCSRPTGTAKCYGKCATPTTTTMGIRLANGNVLLLCLAELPHEIASRVRGGQAGSEHECKMHADYLVEMTIDGRVVWEWRSWEHLAPETDCIINPQDTRREWTHGNGVAELPDGNIVVSFRLISTVITIERRTGEVIWKLGPPALNNQHAPTPLPNGNTLICGGVFGRLFEVTHAGEVVWEYISPYFGNDPQRGPTNSIFRAYRFATGWSRG